MGGISKRSRGPHMPLADSRLELYAQLRAAGFTQSAAGREFGWTRANAWVKEKRNHVRRRIIFLQQQSAEEAVAKREERMEILSDLARGKDKRYKISAIRELNEMDGSHAPKKIGLDRETQETANKHLEALRGLKEEDDKDAV